MMGNMQQFLSMSAVTTVARFKAIADIQDAIMGVGGWVVDHTMYSNKSLALRFSLPHQNIDRLGRGLANAGVHLDGDSVSKIRNVPASTTREGEITVSINVTFVHDDPDLTLAIPAIPG